MKILRALLIPATAVTLQAGITRVANTTLTLPAKLPSSTGFTTQNALEKNNIALTFSAPIDMASPPGVTNRLFVVERGSGIQMVNLDTMTKSTFVNLSSYLTARGRPVTTTVECGILSMAFHPRYNENGYFFVFYSFRENNQTWQRVARFQATGTAGNYNAALTADPANAATPEQPLITQLDQDANHNGGDLAFGPDGYLYISAGDEGAQGDSRDNARRIAKDFFGGILRLDVDSRPGSLAPNPHDESSTATTGDSAVTAGSYRIPPDNPFVALAQGTGNATYNGFTFPKSSIRTEFYAIGFRNPWRMSFDPGTGRLFVGDVGQDRYEEVDLVTSGFNGGWSWREGKHNYTSGPAPTQPAAPTFQSTDPIYEYDRTNDGQGSGNDAVISGSSITGGLVYRGDRLPELFGKYLFCDYNSGYVVALTEGAGGTWTGARIASQVSSISGWGYDPRNNDALLCNHSAGTILRLVRSAPTGTEPPATLSAAGVFQNLTTLTPNAGIVAYEPNVSFWSDYALKSRWFSVPKLADKITFNASGNWTFPEGTVWVKHFELERERGNPATRRRLETRLLVKTADDTYGLSYRWNNFQSGTQTEASLVSEEGLSEVLNLTVNGAEATQTWRFPSRTECRTCHTPVAGHALSFNTPQMNRAHDFGGETQNQLAALRDAGYFTASVPAAPETLPAFAPAGDTASSLEWRVRSYLSVNCVQCHQPGGTSTGYWDARATTPTDSAGLMDGLLLNNGGDPANRWARADGDTAHSMVLKRLAGEGVPRMPPLATNTRDLEAEQLLTAWIQSLPSRQSYAQWQTTYFGASPGGEADPGADPDHDGQTNLQEYLAGTVPGNPGSAWSLSVSTEPDGSLRFSFPQPGNRAVQLETSADFTTWSLWDVPGNGLIFPATAQNRVLTGPSNGDRRFFRARFTQP